MNADTIPAQKKNNGLDSLDLDTTGNFITTNFSKVIEEKIHNSVRKIDTIVMECIQNEFSKSALTSMQSKLIAEGFTKRDDSMDYQKRDFNTRLFLNIEYRKTSIMITHGMDLWDSGKKYRAVTVTLKQLH